MDKQKENVQVKNEAFTKKKFFFDGLKRKLVAKKQAEAAAVEEIARIALVTPKNASKKTVSSGMEATNQAAKATTAGETGRSARGSGCL